MPPSLTTDHVLSLAPDAASAKSGKSLSSPRSWLSLGQHDQALWGECQGSGREPYRTQIDLSEPAFRCSCPSRKFPCKHSIGLMLLLAGQPAAVPEAAPPGWVEEWLATRAKSAAAREQRRQAAEDDPAAAEGRRAASQAKAAAAREAKVSAGAQELGVWLRDQLREGLAAAPGRAPAAFERMAARMVDAQAPGLARLLRAMAGTPASGDGWQGRLLEQLARMHLLVEGYARVKGTAEGDVLTAEEQADIRSAIGFTQSQEDLLRGAGRRDRWRILGRRVEDEDRLRVQRTWLWGESCAAPALVLDFSAAGQPLDRSLIPGGSLDADLAFFPGAAPLRALVQRRHGGIETLTALPSFAIAAALGSYAAALARSPWLERYPLCLGPIRLAQTGDGWLVCDESGRGLPLAPQFGRAWELVARSGGHPFSLCGEWDGDRLTPISAWVDGFIDLGGSV
ncbi:SWIM zinc finger family protein [Chloroflexales bacterium ZM16-3]|nr:SWIM zinc finger family protein [Chloroflexales bacterium ZM16-3]